MLSKSWLAKVAIFSIAMHRKGSTVEDTRNTACELSVVFAISERRIPEFWMKRRCERDFRSGKHGEGPLHFNTSWIPIKDHKQMLQGNVGVSSKFLKDTILFALISIKPALLIGKIDITRCITQPLPRAKRFPSGSSAEIHAYFRRIDAVRNGDIAQGPHALVEANVHFRVGPCYRRHGITRNDRCSNKVKVRSSAS